MVLKLFESATPIMWHQDFCLLFIMIVLKRLCLEGPQFENLYIEAEISTHGTRTRVACENNLRELEKLKYLYYLYF